ERFATFQKSLGRPGESKQFMIEPRLARKARRHLSSHRQTGSKPASPTGCGRFALRNAAFRFETRMRVARRATATEERGLLRVVYIDRILGPFPRYLDRSATAAAL